jgi:hypothetical protein
VQATRHGALMGMCVCVSQVLNTKEPEARAAGVMVADVDELISKLKEDGKI